MRYRFRGRKDFVLLIKAVKDKDEPLDFEASRCLNKPIKDFSSCRYGKLDEDEIKLSLNRRNDIDKLRRQYNRNVGDDEGALFWQAFIITSRRKSPS